MESDDVVQSDSDGDVIKSSSGESGSGEDEQELADFREKLKQRQHEQFRCNEQKFKT